MDCPKCKIPLNEISHKDGNCSVMVDYCEKCSGTWFDKDELEQLENTIEPVFFEIRKIPASKEQLLGLYCPSCSESVLMQKIEHPRDAKVLMDVCPSCYGFWLDKGELEAIQKENWLISLKDIFRSLLGLN